MASTSDEEFDFIDQQHFAGDTAADELKPSSSTAVLDGEDLAGQQSDDSVAETSLEGTESFVNHPPSTECEMKPTSTPMDETKNDAGLGATESHMHSLAAQVEQATGLSRTEEPANYPLQLANYKTNPNAPSPQRTGHGGHPRLPRLRTEPQAGAVPSWPRQSDQRFGALFSCSISRCSIWRIRSLRRKKYERRWEVS